MKKWALLFVVGCLLLAASCGVRILGKKGPVANPMQCKHVALRIKNTGSKPVYKYIVFAGKHGVYEFSGLQPDSFSSYQCVPAYDKIFNNNLYVLLSPTDTIKMPPDPTNNTIPTENLITEGRITLLVSCNYQDVPKPFSYPMLNAFSQQEK
jgi:hypothetical protein